MAAEKSKTTLKAALLGNVEKIDDSKLRSGVSELFKTTSGYELADAVVEGVQRYARETIVDIYGEREGIDFDDFSTLGPFYMDKIRDIIRDELNWYLSSFISDSHREYFVRAHAQGISTSDAATELMWSDETMNRLAQEDALGAQGLRDALIPRVAYLKPGSARWPEKKYGAEWREAREAHRQTVSDIPLTSKEEQMALLAKHAERTNRILENKSFDAKEYQLLTNSLMQTLKNLRELSAVEVPVTENLSPPQIVAVLERLTLALRAPDQKSIGGDAQQLVWVLEKLALALKAPDQKTEGNGANALPTPNGDGGENPDEAN